MIENPQEFFFKEALEKHGKYLVQILSEDIRFNDIIDSQKLHNSLKYSVEKVAGNFQLNISFIGYGRALEIAQNKSKSLNIESADDTKKKFKVENKNYQWYSKNVYGSLNSLYSKLSYGFTEIEVERIKKIIASSADGTVIKNIKV